MPLASRETAVTYRRRLSDVTITPMRDQATITTVATARPIHHQRASRSIMKSEPRVS